jgi:hypothetical protein
VGEEVGLYVGAEKGGEIFGLEERCGVSGGRGTAVRMEEPEVGGGTEGEIEAVGREDDGLMLFMTEAEEEGKEVYARKDVEISRRFIKYDEGTFLS